MSCPRCPEGYVSCTFCMRLPAKPEHDAEVEAIARPLRLGVYAPDGSKEDILGAKGRNNRVNEALRRAVEAGVALAERTLLERGAKHLATAKAEGYREGREQGAKDMLDSTMDTLAAGAQRLNAERNKLEADAHATGYREGLAAGKAGGSQELSSAELVMHYVRAEREACARLVYLWTEPFDRRLISAAICARGEPTPQGSDS